MFHSNNRLCLIFDSSWGSFRVEADEHSENLFALKIETTGNTPQKLGDFCSITDAISAVGQQQTGYSEWDQLSTETLPHRVHNIASWDFQENLGTITRAACS